MHCGDLEYATTVRADEACPAIVRPRNRGPASGGERRRGRNRRAAGPDPESQGRAARPKSRESIPNCQLVDSRERGPGRPCAPSPSVQVANQAYNSQQSMRQSVTALCSQPVQGRGRGRKSARIAYQTNSVPIENYFSPKRTTEACGALDYAHQPRRVN